MSDLSILKDGLSEYDRDIEWYPNVLFENWVKVKIPFVWFSFFWELFNVAPDAISDPTIETDFIKFLLVVFIFY